VNQVGLLLFDSSWFGLVHLWLASKFDGDTCFMMCQCREQIATHDVIWVVIHDIIWDAFDSIIRDVEFHVSCE